MEIRNFVERPAIIKAVKWDGSEESAKEICAWVGATAKHAILLREPWIQISIWSGDAGQAVYPGDYVVEVRPGVFERKTPRAFEEMYEPAPENGQRGEEA